MSNPEVLDVGLIAGGAKTVVVSAVLETVGQVRFGDGTDVNLTVTEKDLIPDCTGNKLVKKVVFSGSKRRGIDRRTIHALRNHEILKVCSDNNKLKDYSDALAKVDASSRGDKNNKANKGNLKAELDKLVQEQPMLRYLWCYIPNLCLECPICWLYGGTGATGGDEQLHGKKEYNIKSRVLYASACSVEPAEVAVAVHSRNAVDEQQHTTTGEAGIHSEELIKGGIHFPTLTALDRVVDWEIGAFAHAFLENVNTNRYTAASARQGGLKIAEGDRIGKLVVVDVSANGIFPLETVKVPAYWTDYQRVASLFADAGSLEAIKAALEKQGFQCDWKNDGDAKKLEVKRDNGKVLWWITANNGVIQVSQAADGDQSQDRLLMTRYIGDRAFGYLRDRQEDFKQFLEQLRPENWDATLSEIKKRLRLDLDKKQAVSTSRKTKGSVDEETGEQETEDSPDEASEEHIADEQ